MVSFINGHPGNLFNNKLSSSQASWCYYTHDSPFYHSYSCNELKSGRELWFLSGAGIYKAGSCTAYLNRGGINYAKN